MGIDWIGWTENLNMVLGGWKRISKRGERETDLNRAGAAVDGRGQPVDCAIAVNQHIDIEGNIELTVITVEGNRKTWLLWLQPWIACINVARLFFFCGLSLTCLWGRCRDARPCWEESSQLGCCRIHLGSTTTCNLTKPGWGWRRDVRKKKKKTNTN